MLQSILPPLMFLYEHEIDTTKEVMAKILGVRQASKILSCNGCTRKIIEVVSPNKAVCSFCKLQQVPSTCNVDWNLRILVKPESESNKNLQIRLDHTATETLLHMLNATYDRQSATEDDIVATILENYETLYYFTYDCLTRNLIGSAIMKVIFKPIKFRVTSRFPRLTSS